VQLCIEIEAKDVAQLREELKNYLTNPDPHVTIIDNVPMILLHTLWALYGKTVKM